MTDFPVTSQQWDASHPKAKAITKHLGTMICKDLQPYKIVEDSGFRAYTRALEPRYKIPTRSHLTRVVIPELYNERNRVIRASIAEATTLSITSDIWTSNQNDPFISLTAHYLDSKFVLHSDCLNVSHFPEAHTGENIADIIHSCLVNWLPEEKVDLIPLYTVTDNASNMKKAMRLLNPAQHVPCFAHTLHLAVSAAIKEFGKVTAMVSKAKSVVSYFHHSARATSRLTEAQIQRKLPTRKLKQECITRWNSSYEMINRLVEQKEAVNLVLNSVENVESLTPAEWRCASDYVRVLQPFEEATTILSAARYPTFSMVILLVSINMRAWFSRMLCTSAEVLFPVAAFTCRERVRVDIANSSARKATVTGPGKVA